MKTKMSTNETKKLSTEDLSAKDWWWRVLYHGEAQLSKRWYGTQNDFEKRLPYQINMEKMDENHPRYLTNRKFKSEYTSEKDSELDSGVDIHKRVTSVLHTDAICIWEPVFKYLIQQVPNAYLFNDEQLFTEFVGREVSYGKKEYTSYTLYLGVCVPNSELLFKNIKNTDEEIIEKLNKKISYTAIFALIGFSLSYFFNDSLGFFFLLGFLFFLGYAFYKKNKIVNRSIPREIKLNMAFPQKRSDNSLIKTNHRTTKLDIFLNETHGVKKFDYLSKQRDITPSYVQDGNAISLSLEKNGRFKLIFGKKIKIDPIIFFQGKNVVTLPFNNLDNHPIMVYLKKHIDIQALDIPEIIQDYLEKTLPPKV